MGNDWKPFRSDQRQCSHKSHALIWHLLYRQWLQDQRSHDGRPCGCLYLRWDQLCSSRCRRVQHHALERYVGSCNELYRSKEPHHISAQRSVLGPTSHVILREATHFHVKACLSLECACIRGFFLQTSQIMSKYDKSALSQYTAQEYTQPNKRSSKASVVVQWERTRTVSKPFLSCPPVHCW